MAGLPIFSRLEKAVHFEDLASRKAIKHLTLENIQIESTKDNYRIRITTEKEKAIKSERWKEMQLCLVPMQIYRIIYNRPENCYNVPISEIQRGTITIETRKRLKIEELQHIDFIPNRIGNRACSNALKSLNEMPKLKSFYLNFVEPTDLSYRSYMNANLSSYARSSVNLRSETSLSSQNVLQLQSSSFGSFEFDWYNKGIKTNQEQMLAILNIVNCKSCPYPQVIFGPPGTGKTSTLVECVAQILKLRPKSRVLITTQSNSASDEIGARLLKFVSINKVYRLYSPSLLNPTSGGPHPTLKASSNLRNKKVEWPTKEELQHFRVVISTLITSSRLANSDLAPGHFDFIFVDEISCATEP